MSNRYLSITFLSLWSILCGVSAQTLSQPPRLVVTITVDQLRTDLMETYAPLFRQDGLRRLMTEGAVYPNASCNFSPVDRASATASLMTGATPYYNGVPGIEWLDRSTLRPQNIVNDRQQGASPRQMQTSTLGDELKIASQGTAKVFAFALDAESAILSAGHAADGAVWLSQGRWNVSSFYTPQVQWLNWCSKQYPPTDQDPNRNLTNLVLHSLEQSGIGQDQQTDLLSLSYRVEGTAGSYQLLDHNIGDLLNAILQKIPREQVLFLLTGTGSIEAAGSDDYERYRIPTGKFYINRTANLLNMYIGAMHGTGQYVETSFHNQLYLNRKLIEKKNLNLGDLLRLSQEFLLLMEGVRNVYTSNQLMTSDSQTLQKIRNGFCMEKCGDLIIEVAPGWQLVNEDTHTIATSRVSNIAFPIIFFGSGVTQSRSMQPVTIDRVAPTLSRAIGIRSPNACAAEPLLY